MDFEPPDRQGDRQRERAPSTSTPRASARGFTEDLKPANDIAKILVNGGERRPGGGDGDGGSLPITGQSTGLIAGLGALLLAAGVGGYLVAKRRRTRFVA